MRSVFLIDKRALGHQFRAKGVNVQLVSLDLSFVIASKREERILYVRAVFTICVVNLGTYDEYGTKCCWWAELGRVVCFFLPPYHPRPQVRVAVGGLFLNIPFFMI